VPGFVCRTPFAVGVREAVRWYDAHPEEQRVDAQLDEAFDRLVAAARRS
jgi:hypothetical protein